MTGPCRCSRHNVAAAGWRATAETAGFRMRLPEWVETCTDVERPVSPEVVALWRRVYA